MDSITVTVTLRRNIAAVMAAAYADGATDPQAWLQSVVDRACYSYRDQYRTDAVTSAAFIRRFNADEMAAIEAAAQVVQQLADWLARVEAEPLVWLGSDEAQAGKAALVAGNLLTQERADVIFAYPLPQPPELPT